MEIARKSLEAQSPLEPDPSAPGPSSRHIPALDGLRGIAVLMVMLFHCFLRSGWQQDSSRGFAQVALAGWLGVDVFFVLSGFLITGILLDTRRSARFFVNFYARRALRILPIYYLVLAVTLLIIPIFVPYNTPSLNLIFDRQGWLWLHLTNIGFIVHRKAWLLSPWLDLSHLWSLAVEEQFYFVWPAIVWAVAIRRLWIVCVLGVAGSPLLRLALWYGGQTGGAMYFATPCRVDGLALGALVALAIRRDNFSISDKMTGAMFAVGFAGLMTLAWARNGLWFGDKATIAFAPIAVNLIAAAIVLKVAKGDSIVAKIFESAPLRFSGKYSYGLYLFHPLLAAPLGIMLLDANRLGHVGGYQTTLLYSAIIFGLSFGMALLSFHGFERRWLNLRSRFHADE